MVKKHSVLICLLIGLLLASSQYFWIRTETIGNYRGPANIDKSSQIGDIFLGCPLENVKGDDCIESIKAEVRGFPFAVVQTDERNKVYYTVKYGNYNSSTSSEVLDMNKTLKHIVNILISFATPLVLYLLYEAFRSKYSKTRLT
jgi:hypothetical protein